VSRRIFIGDIQGCLAELERLLEAVDFQQGSDELHPVGDLVNRGPDSLGVLRLLASLGAGGVLGNHDLHLLRSSRGLRAMRKEDTLEPVLAAEDADALIEWLAERPFVRAWDDILLVHAGLDPTWSDPVEQLRGVDPFAVHPDSDFATRVRYCDPQGKRPDADWPVPPAPFRPWFEFLPAGSGHPGRTVVYGHWARRGLVERPGLRGLDSGCVWGKSLTAWIAEEDRIVQVDAARVYCPHDD